MTWQPWPARLVKWSYEVRRLADLPRAVHRAATTALAPPRGPVFLSIPSDVLTESAELELGAPTRIGAGVRPDPAAVEEAARLIGAARSPVIFAGDAVAQCGAHAQMVRFAELVGAPVYAEDLANTASFPTSHPLFAGTVARLGAAIRTVLDGHDLLVSIGADLFTLSLGGGPEPVPPGLPIVHVDVDPWQLGKNFPTAAALLGDPRMILPELCRRRGAGPPCRRGPAARRCEAGHRRPAKGGRSPGPRNWRAAAPCSRWRYSMLWDEPCPPTPSSSRKPCHPMRASVS